MPAANAAAFAFLAARQSQPAKLFAGPVPSREALEPIAIAWHDETEKLLSR